MNTISPVHTNHRRVEVLRAQYRYGLFYGAMVGLLFAFFAWGIDAFALFRAHGTQPWLKLIIGLLVCIPFGGLSGWLTMRFERMLLSIPFWLVSVAIFAEMTVALPLQIFPKLLTWLEPDLVGLVSYGMPEVMTARFFTSFIWAGIFVSIAGILEIPLGQPAAFSTSTMGKLLPVLLCAVLMGIGATVVENDNNKPLRSAVISMDETLKMAAKYQGQQIDKKLARDLHLASLRKITDQIGHPYELNIGSFDQFLEQVHVIVRFDNNTLADCLTVYDQPLSCEPIAP
jgi:hypothetical protein